MSRLVFHNNKMVFITYDITKERPFIDAEVNLLYHSIESVKYFLAKPYRFTEAVQEMVHRSCKIDLMDSDFTPYDVRIERPLAETSPKNLYVGARIKKKSASKSAREELVLRN